MCCSTVNTPTVANTTTTTTENKEVTAQPAPSEIIEAPCSHNKWTRARRLRQGGVLLRCQECNSSWPTRMEYHEKCPEFYAGSCTKGGDCPRPHIYARGALSNKDEQESNKGESMVSLRALKGMRKKALKSKKNKTIEDKESSETSSDAGDSTSGSSSCCISNEDSSSVSSPEVGYPAIVYRYDPYSADSFVYC